MKQKREEKKQIRLGCRRRFFFSFTYTKLIFNSISLRNLFSSSRIFKIINIYRFIRKLLPFEWKKIIKNENLKIDENQTKKLKKKRMLRIIQDAKKEKLVKLFSKCAFRIYIYTLYIIDNNPNINLMIFLPYFYILMNIHH